ncbi:hypothetical protein RIF29_35415 [Crotalaria pallida]|uniref:Uncharacterized protein n=1 Tax=Crotalaria pallida TaxID=3830 RepID=A0AAN9EFL6_CROPI
MNGTLSCDLSLFSFLFIHSSLSLTFLFHPFHTSLNTQSQIHSFIFHLLHTSSPFSLVSPFSVSISATKAIAETNH